MFLMGQEDWRQWPAPPGQPTFGPGGSDYTCNPETEVFVWPPIDPIDPIPEGEYHYPVNSHLWWLDKYPEDLDCNPHDPGTCPLEGFIYAPACLEEAPVVFFYHMYLGDLRKHYHKFRKHLAAKGYIVIAPRYHRPPVLGVPDKMFDQVVGDGVKAAVKGAQAGLEYYETYIRDLYDVPAPLYEQPDPDKPPKLVYGIAGHSMGTTHAAALANPQEPPNIPRPPPTRKVVIDDVRWDDWNPKAVVLMAGGQVGDLSARCPGWQDQAICMRDTFAHYVACEIFDLLNDPDNSYVFCEDFDFAAHPELCPYGKYEPLVGEGCDGDPENPNCVWDNQHCATTDGRHHSGDLSAIDYNPLWIVMSGEDDWEGVETPHLQGYCRATQIEDKHYLRVLSDNTGRPALIAEHTGPAGDDMMIESDYEFLPLWTDQVDAHDWYAYWKIVTAAMDCATKGDNCEYARGGGADQIYMGEWSDGTPVNEMQYNPRVRDNGGCWKPPCNSDDPDYDLNNPDFDPRCYDLEDACSLVNQIVYEDGDTKISAWKWRHKSIPDNCAGNEGDPCYRPEDCVSESCTDGKCD
jgi:hypothetical protein